MQAASGTLIFCRCKMGTNTGLLNSLKKKTEKVRKFPPVKEKVYLLVNAKYKFYLNSRFTKRRKIEAKRSSIQ